MKVLFIDDEVSEVIIPGNFVGCDDDDIPDYDPPSDPEPDPGITF